MMCPHRQNEVRRAVRLRRARFGRSPSPYRRGRIHDSHQGEPGTGDVQAVTHMRAMQSEIRRVAGMAEDELFEAAKQLGSVRPAQGSARQRQTPRCQLRCRWCGDPGRRGAHDALGAEGVFVARHFQERQPRKARCRHREGRRELRRCKTHRRAFRRFRRSHGGHQRKRNRPAYGRARQIIRLPAPRIAAFAFNA